MYAGWIIGGLSKIWTSSHYAQYTVKLLLAINILAFLDSIRTINSVESKLDYAGLDNICREFELKVRLFANQRNAYISGFNVFLSMVFFRLFVTMKQMHQWRQELKEQEKTAAAEQEDKKQK